MGSIWTSTNELTAFFGERIGFKSGLALTRKELVDHIGANDSIASAIASESDQFLRIRADEIEDAFQRVLYKLGRLDTEFVGHGPTLLYFKYHDEPEKYSYVQQIMVLLEEARRDAGKQLLSDEVDEATFFGKVAQSLPKEAMPIAVELLDLIQQSERASPWHWNPGRQVAWKDTIELEGLFARESLEASHGTFFDQRFIDYLVANFDKIDSINWRKFEGLTAEYFTRLGYEVKIGPGRNDGGIDVRAWKFTTETIHPPLILVQCKRQKDKVDKTVVKALWADVIDEKAASGLVVTSSGLSPGADAVRLARSYPIDVADRATLKDWLLQLKTPGTGIFLGS